jgi:Flp pilus assembly protein TadG
MRRLLRDRRGATAVLVAISLPILLAIAGLGVDAGWWFTIKRQNQSGADAAALSAAYEIVNGNTSVTNYLVPAATQAATQNGYGGGALTGVSANGSCTDPGTSFVCYTYSDANFSGVEVVLRQQQNSWLANFGSLAKLTIANRAVAEVKVLSKACVLALSKTGTGIGFTGNYGVTTPNCSLIADSTSTDAIDGVGNGCIDAYTLESAGHYSFTGNSVAPCTANGYDLSSPAQLGGPNVADPYAGTLTHAFLTAGMPAPTTACPAPTATGSPGNQTITYRGNCFISGGLSVSGNDTLNLSSGTQITGGLSFTGNGTINLSGDTQIDGGLNFIGNGTINLSSGTYWLTDGSLTETGNVTLDCPSCSPGGAGTTIIFTTTQGSAGTIGTFQPTGNLTVDLNAPGSGTYAGYLFLQDDTVAGVTPASGGTIGNTASSDTLNGLIYFPGSNLNFVGNISPSANCLAAVANTFTFTGNIGLDSTGCPIALPALETVLLVE